VSADDPVMPTHAKYINIDWYRNDDGYQYMLSWDVVKCSCSRPWGHWP
jgi:hypothetical protein